MDVVDRLLALEPARVAVLLVDFQREFCEPPGMEAASAGTLANAGMAVRANAFAAGSLAPSYHDRLESRS
ncbi:MAG: hypothetical protein J2P15_06485 [Micromonosporaceae bacterium]|nr:hypothetical protein [Micromonosporaceae bacterium]